MFVNFYSVSTLLLEFVMTYSVTEKVCINLFKLQKKCFEGSMQTSNPNLFCLPSILVFKQAH